MSRGKRGARPLRLDESHGYTRMRVRNQHTGEREDVILLSPARLAQHPALVRSPNVEAHADIQKAMASFTPIQRRVLAYVLIQGQSIEVATARMNKSAVHWRRWLEKEALPLLRKKLSYYYEKSPTHQAGKVVL